jgi:radical SAM protein with 4Fe4S-binding SPASM domain
MKTERYSLPQYRKESWPTRLDNGTDQPFFSSMPKDVGISITGRCQLRCHHCFNRSGPDVKHELPLEVIERFLNEVASWGVKFLRLSGGEPTFHGQFRQVLDACRRRELRVAMNSHGVYRPDLLEYLKTAAIELFMISIDGMEANNDTIRGRGVFQRATHACRELLAAGQRVMICTHIAAGNLADVPALIALAGQMGADIKFSPIRPVGRAAEEMPGADLTRPEDYHQVVRHISELRPRYPHIKIVTDFDVLDASPVPTGECRRDPGSSSCKAGRTMVNINYDGGIYPCAFFVTPDGAFSGGNIYHQTVGQTWIRSPVFEPFRVQRKSDLCQSCGHYGARCVGGCPAVAHFTSGALDSHDPTCFAHLIDPAPAPLAAARDDSSVQGGLSL